MTLYDKNVQALEKNRPTLYDKLKTIDTNEQFEVFLPKGESYPNILDHDKEILFYIDAKHDIEATLKDFQKYREYPFLYIFGMADGKALYETLKNEKIRQLVVIEPHIELIYVALNLWDFSQDLKNNRLLILPFEEVTLATVVELLHSSNAKYYVRTFELIMLTRYYESYYFEQYKAMYNLFLKGIDYVTKAHGNDINDSFRGVKQHIETMEYMVEHLPYQELLKLQSIDTAVIVSTGPSLDKQLPLLKAYQDRVVILSVDASFPILVEYGIKPDFVLSMERDEPTAKFFERVDAKDHKDVMFLCASLQHKAVFDAIKGEQLFVVMRPFAYNIYFGLNAYGYLCKGLSAANMAHEFASAFGFKQTIFIGQDLAFGEGLKTHANNHTFEQDPELQAEIEGGRIIETEAYGGKGTVKTNVYWNIFRNFIEHHIEETTPSMMSYNATEGGARIEGAVEITFKEALEKFATVKKPKLHVDAVSDDEIRELKLQVATKLQTIQVESKALQESINRSFLMIADACKVLENRSIDEAVTLLSMGETIKLIDEISKIRKEIETSEIYNTFLISIIQPLLHSMELEIAEIKVRYVDNARDNQIKAIQWILAHRYWLFSFSGVIENVLHVIEEHQKI